MHGKEEIIHSQLNFWEIVSCQHMNATQNSISTRIPKRKHQKNRIHMKKNTWWERERDRRENIRPKCQRGQGKPWRGSRTRCSRRWNGRKERRRGRQSTIRSNPPSPPSAEEITHTTPTFYDLWRWFDPSFKEIEWLFAGNVACCMLYKDHILNVSSKRNEEERKGKEDYGPYEIRHVDLRNKVCEKQKEIIMKLYPQNLQRPIIIQKSNWIFMVFFYRSVTFVGNLKHKSSHISSNPIEANFPRHNLIWGRVLKLGPNVNSARPLGHDSFDSTCWA